MKTTPLAIMCGLPRSGKTTVARQLEQSGWVRVSLDDIRMAMYGAAFIERAEPYIVAIAQTMAHALILGGHKVVVDDVNFTTEQRRTWVQLATELGVRLNVHFIDTPYEVCCTRNSGPHRVPETVLDYMCQEFERPTSAEGSLITLVHNDCEQSSQGCG